MWIFFKVLVTLSVVQCLDLPPFLHVCHKNEPDLVQCMISSIESFKPTLIRGHPELEIPPFEPLYIGEVDLKNYVSAQGLSIEATEVQVYGISKFNIKSLSVVEYGRKYRILLEFPQMYSFGKYKAQGRVGFLQLAGSGMFQGNFSRGTSDIRIKLEPKVIKNETYAIVSRIAMKIGVKNGRLKMGNIFGDDQVLNDLTNSAINENFEVFSRELYPLVEKVCSKIVKKLANNIISKFTEQQLFP